MAKIKVIDSIMSAGKTSWAIQFMNDNPERKFLFVTPLLSEVDRIIKYCPFLDFIQPEKPEYGTKSDNLKDLLAEGRNIVSTHALFQRIDDETISLIKKGNYTLILDEVMDVIHDLKVKPSEVEAMFRSRILEKEDIADRVAYLRPGKEECLEKYRDYREYAKQKRLVYVDNSVLIWLFPVEVFEAFKEIYNLCYLFDGQFQKAYYQTFGLEFEYFSVIKEGKVYAIVPHDPRYDQEIIARLRPLVEIYEGKLNGSVGKGKGQPFSKTWLDNRSKPELVRIRNNTYNFFRHIAKGKSKNAMWTTFKSHKGKLQGAGYSRGFVSKSIRGTNVYRHKARVAYLISVFFHPYVKKYFSIQDIQIDEDLYALSEMIQWIWRSQIRDGKPIVVYVPSERMRNLLRNWLELPN